MIEYELQLPNTKTGEKLAKTIGRILKHAYSAKRLRVETSKESLIVTAKVEKMHLNAIRGAVQMTLTAKGITGNLERSINAERIEGGAGSNGDCGARTTEIIQTQSPIAAHDP